MSAAAAAPVLAAPRIASPWFKVFRPNPHAAMRLFCFTPVGAGASFYSGWGTGWDEIEVCAVQLPGRESRVRDRPITRMTELVRHLAAELPLGKPFAFFGHSLGAMVAHDLACALIDQGKPLPTHLLLSACPAPQVARFRRNRHLLPQPELIDYLRLLGGTPEEILADSEIMDFSLPTVRADFEVADTYDFVQRPPLPIPVTAYAGISDAEVFENEVAAWRFRAGGTFRLKVFPGDHFYLHPQGKLLAQDILQTISPTRTRA